MVQAFIIALILVNIWHAYLGIFGKKQHKTTSVSESAAAHENVLIIHKIIHILCASVFIIYASVLILDNAQYVFPSVLLVMAATLDIIQAVTLNKHTNHQFGKLSDTHQTSAWLMSVSYLMACLLFLLTTASIWVAIAICVTLFITYMWLRVTAMRYFYFAQMIFFFVVSAGLGTAAVLI